MKKTSSRYHHALCGAAALVFLILIILGVVVFFYQRSGGPKIFSPELAGDKCQTKNWLTGVCLKENEKNFWPAALMIDNHPNSWPQSGLSRAGLVYNTLVEGGQTRLMAVFDNLDDIKKIGPVRSARPYYLTWAKEIDAFYGHSGGSVEAIKKIKEYGVRNLEEATSYGPKYFWRDAGQWPPHNLFTSGEKLKLALQDFELASTTPGFEVWQFAGNLKPVSTSATKTAEKISINYSNLGIFNVSYEWNTTAIAYLRFQNNKPFIDALDKKQIAVKNLIIQFVPEEIHLDKDDRLRIETIGSGQAWIFFNEKIIRGSWQKKDLNSRTKFYDASGQEIIFPAGNVWIEVVPGERTIEIKKLDPPAGGEK